VKAFDNSSGKWLASMPEMATSLLVSLSARLLKWQNPAEGFDDLLRLVTVKSGWLTRGFSARLHALQSYLAFF
jgi:hypothetical protein